MTGEELYAYIKRGCPLTDQYDRIYDAITDTILDVKIQLKLDLFKKELAITGISVLGNYKLDLPTDYSWLIGDVMFEYDSTSGYPLVKLNKEQFDELYPYPTATTVSKGQPVHYCIFGGKVLLGPVPDKLTYVYSISYTSEANVQVVADTTNVPFSTYNREMLRYGCLFRLYSNLESDASLRVDVNQRYLRKDIETQKWKTLYQESVDKIKLQDLRNTRAPSNTQYQDI